MTNAVYPDILTASVTERGSVMPDASVYQSVYFSLQGHATEPDGQFVLVGTGNAAFFEEFA